MSFILVHCSEAMAICTHKGPSARLTTGYLHLNAAPKHRTRNPLMSWNFLWKIPNSLATRIAPQKFFR